MIIAHVVFPVPVDSHFDYIIPEYFASAVVPGCRVQAVFARKKCVGIVVGGAAGSSYENLNTLIKVLDPAPVFSVKTLAFARTFALWNSCSFGEALFLFLPAALWKVSSRKNVPAGQERVLSTHVDDRSGLIMDSSLTRRWDSLLSRMRTELAAGRGVLVLVPENSCLEEVLPRIEALAPADSRVLLRQDTEKNEFDRWIKVHTGQARLVAGYLSAIFAPVRSLGLIIVLDEESRFYKSDQSPFYHAREAAFQRAAIEGAAVICVSSAPSVELWREVAEGRLPVERFDAALPAVRFLDISNFKMKKGSLLSPGLRLHLEGVLKAGGKALLYVPAGKGAGFVLEEIKKYMPQACAAGYDQASVNIPEVDIVVATRAVFRYRGRRMFDFCAVLDIDYEFHKADHRAAHGAFALVQYLRQMAKKSVLLQTREPKSELLHAIADDKPEKFYAAELRSRKEMGFPPYGVLVALVVRSVDPELACAEAKRLYDMFIADGVEGVNVMEPQQDRSAVLRGKFRWCVMLQGSDRVLLVKAARGAALKFRGKKDTILTVNIDP